MLLPFLVTVTALVTAFVLVAQRSFVIAQPDEWLLTIRNGALLRAGVGIQLWRRPGDVVVRFTSTMQRVSFTAAALTEERLPVTVEAFILWSVSSEDDAPFRAYQKLGLVNVDAPPAGLRSPKHLLSTPQHHAFQRLLGAMVRRLASRVPLAELLTDHGTLVALLRDDLRGLEEDLGIRVDRMGVRGVQPNDDEVRAALSAEVEEQLRAQAGEARLRADERAALLAIESETRVADERAAAHRLTLAREEATASATLDKDQRLALRRAEVAHEQAMEAETRALELARAVAAREAVDLEAQLDRLARRATVEAEALTVRARAEQGRSQADRDHELGCLVAEKVGDALKTLPLREARWVTVGNDSPATSLAGVVAATRELLGASP